MTDFDDEPIEYTYNCASCGSQGECLQDEQCPCCGETNHDLVAFDEILLRF